MTKKEKQRDNYLFKKYGITSQQYNMMAAKGCHLCGRFPKEGQRRFAVDHAHYGLKKTRGILCYYCNKYRVGKLNLDWAIKVVEYLQKYE